MWMPTDIETFLLFFENTTTDVAAGYAVSNGEQSYIGIIGTMWEGWRVMSGFLNIPDMSGKFPVGWDRSGEAIATESVGSRLSTSGGASTQQTSSVDGNTVATPSDLIQGNPIDTLVGGTPVTTYLRRTITDSATDTANLTVTTAEHTSDPANLNVSTDKKVSLYNHVHEVTENRPPFQTVINLIKV